jgi:hypothetical protein
MSLFGVFPLGTNTDPSIHVSLVKQIFNLFVYNFKGFDESITICTAVWKLASYLIKHAQILRISACFLLPSNSNCRIYTPCVPNNVIFTFWNMPLAIYLSESTVNFK